MKEKLIINRVESLLDGMEGIEEECIIDSLVRIDENIYECDNCILADTVNTVREGMTDKSICPMIMKEEVNDVIR